MIKTLLILMLITFSNVYSQSKSNDFATSDSKRELLTNTELRKRFEVVGEVFVTDKNGKLLMKANEWRLWKFGSKGDLESNWSFSSPGINNIALKHVWTLQDDGRIFIHIQQFDSLKRNESGKVEAGKLLKEQKIELKDFSAITWTTQVEKNEKIVVRLTPRLVDKVDFIEVSNFPISLSNPVIFDNKGRVWADGGKLESKYVIIKTHVGQLAFSYTPFKGAKEIGTAQGNQIDINAEENLKIHIRTDLPILVGTSPARIYGIVNLKNRTSNVNSVYYSSTNQEGDFLESLK